MPLTSLLVINSKWLFKYGMPDVPADMLVHLRGGAPSSSRHAHKSCKRLNFYSTSCTWSMDLCVNMGT